MSLQLNKKLLLGKYSNKLAFSLVRAGTVDIHILKKKEFISKYNLTELDKIVNNPHRIGRITLNS